MEAFLKQYTLENPIKTVIAILTSLGFIVLIIYFTKIGHYPATKIDDLPTLFISIGVIGFFFLIIILGTFIIPSSIYNDTSDKDMDGIIYHSSDEDESKNLKAFLYLIPLFFFVTLLSLLLFYAKQVSFLTHTFVSSFLTIVLITLIFFLKVSDDKKSIKLFLKYFYRIIYTFFIIFLSNFILLLSIISNENNDDKLIVVSSFILYIMLFNIIGVIIKDIKLKYLIGFFILISLFSISNNTHKLSFAILKTIGIGGNIPINEIHIKKEKDNNYCDLIDICKNNIIKDSKLVWKLGNELIIEKTNKDNITKRYFINSQKVELIVNNINK